MNPRGMLWVAGYALSIVVANWLIERYGIVPVGFGLTAPAGVYAAGLAFTLRDLTHEAIGGAGALTAVVCGAALSWLISDGVQVGGLVSLAAASGLAFLFSELVDLGVYARLRRRHWLGAVALSNTVGLLVDSALFLALAFGSLSTVWGLALGKLWMTAAAVAVIWIVRQRMQSAGRATRA